MSEEELEKENANLKVLRKYELNVAKLEIEKLEKENAELKEEIEKMKRCQNCDNFDYTENKCKIGWCDNFEKWVLKEVVFVDLKELDDNEL